MAVRAPRVTDGRHSRWDRHNVVRRESIIDAAVGVLEEVGPGGEFHVQQVADAAGLSRTVLYRHFADRADLDTAVRGRVLDHMRAAVVPVLQLEGTPIQIIRRIVAAYTGWAAAHPALHRFVEREVPTDGMSQLEELVVGIARQVEDLINAAVLLLGIDLDEHDRVALDPLVFGFVGSVFTSVRRWLTRPVLEPPAPEFVDMLTQALFSQISGLAALRGGIVLDPDLPVERLLLAGVVDAE